MYSCYFFFIIAINKKQEINKYLNVFAARQDWSLIEIYFLLNSKRSHDSLIWFHIDKTARTVKIMLHQLHHHLSCVCQLSSSYSMNFHGKLDKFSQKEFDKFSHRIVFAGCLSRKKTERRIKKNVSEEYREASCKLRAATNQRSTNKQCYENRGSIRFSWESSIIANAQVERATFVTLT